MVFLWCACIPLCRGSLTPVYECTCVYKHTHVCMLLLLSVPTNVCMGIPLYRGSLIHVCLYPVCRNTHPFTVLQSFTYKGGKWIYYFWNNFIWWFFYIFIHLNFILWLYIYYDPRLNFPFTILVNSSLDKN